MLGLRDGISVVFVDLPLFPIGEITLFPGQALPIYVFEERYRALLARVRATGEAIGVPCLFPRAEATNRAAHDAVGRPAAQLEERLARVGTLAHLTEVTYNPDGSAQIVVVGGDRYRITDFDFQTHPYGMARAHAYPLEDCPKDWVEALAQDTMERFLAKVAPKYGDVRAEIPDEALLQASFIAANLRLPGVDAQRVLQSKNLLERFEILGELLGVRQQQLN